MENMCSMVGCCNTVGCLMPQQFYTFPRNFDLCMLWVQNCGRAELFEDFAYGGAQPFINRVICSDHFNDTDFNDPNCINKGLKPEAVPILNCDEPDSVTIKEEFEDLDDDDEDYEDDTSADDTFEPGVNQFLESEDKINIIKQESVDVEATKLYSSGLVNEFGESEEHFLHEDLEQDKLLDEPYLPLLVISKEKVLLKEGDADFASFQKSQKDFKTAWKKALDSAQQREARNRANALRNAFRRANETEEQRTARNQANALRNASRRASETGDEKKDRLYKNAVRAALRRSMESEDEQKERRRKNALRAAFRRSVETEEQRAERRLKDKVRSADRRKKETDMQSKIRRYNDAVRAAFRRNNETEQQKQQRRMYDVLRAARRRSNENADQRMKRLQADRERAAKRRMVKKLNQNVTNIQNTFFNHDLEPYLNNKHSSSSSSLKSESNCGQATNCNAEENFSSDDLSNQSGYTHSECGSLGTINIGTFSENNKRRNSFSAITDLNNINSFNSNVDVTNFNLQNKRTEVNAIATQEHANDAVATPEVVWCT